MIFDKIWWLEREQRVFERKTRAKIRAAMQQETFPIELLNKLYKDMTIHVAFLEELRQRAISERLRAHATRLNLPVPNESEWTRGEKGAIPFMSPVMQTELRKVIRQEQKERREMWIMVVKDIVAPIGGLIISILSLLIAYAALKLKH